MFTFIGNHSTLFWLAKVYAVIIIFIIFYIVESLSVGDVKVTECFIQFW